MMKVINAILIALTLILFLGLLIAIGADIDSRAKPVQPISNNSNIDFQISKEEIPKLVEVIKIWKLIDKLELSNFNVDKLTKFLAKYEQLETIRSEYWKNRGESISRLKKLIETNASEEQIRLALDELNKIDINFFEKDRQIKESINNILTIRQQAELIIFQDTHWRDMKNLVKDLEKISQIREKQLQNQSQPLSKK
ncbi:MAG: hypothetical protein ACUVWN_07480 [bacterium]